MQLKAAPFFFIIRINKEKQKETRRFEGELIVSPNYVFMQHEVQNGEIVSIGEQANKIFPEAKIGQILLIHHFVTGKGIEDREDSPYLIYDDEIYNYYNVTVISLNGDRNMTYGVFDGEKIIPHSEFIFLKIPEQKKEVVKTDEIIELKNWSESRDKKGSKMAEIKSAIGELTKTKASEELKTEIEKRENVMNKMSKDINKKQISLFNVAYSKLPFTEVGMLNIACNTKISFIDNQFIIAPVKYLFFGNSQN